MNEKIKVILQPYEQLSKQFELFVPLNDRDGGMGHNQSAAQVSNDFVVKSL